MWKNFKKYFNSAYPFFNNKMHYFKLKYATYFMYQSDPSLN